MPRSPRVFRSFLPESSPSDAAFLARLLRQETVGGAVVLVAAVAAMVWANSAWSASYDEVRHYQFGPLDVEKWAADGALALFFYLAGLELKREMLLGSLRQPRAALVPIVAAVAGVLVPAAVYVAVNTMAEDGRLEGWAVPAATDIAFALAVLAVVGRHLPQSLRAFLLTLAVVDDLIVIVIIALFYTSDFALTPLLLATALLAVFAALQRLRGEHWVLYIPLALGIWWFTYDSGVHATIAGVAMGLATRVVPDEDEDHSPAEALEHMLTPVTAGLAVPFFALMAAGVTLSGDPEVWGDPVVLGIIAGLVIGKPLGVLGGAWLVTRLTPATLTDDLSWRDVAGVAMLAGIGFTVALLVAELSFAGEGAEAAKTAVLAGSVLAAVLASVILHRRGRTHRQLREV